MPVLDLQDMRADPYLAATGFFHPRQHPVERGYVEMRLPIRFAAAAARDLAAALALDEHGAELRSEPASNA
jgi:crotonobetainyl-CoA:carnitine CoA-transferase CaiB-like acyl-CoA transferase